MTTSSPRGIRNNNPGNLRDAPGKWQGQTASADGFCVFDTPANGLRALCKQLLVYQRPDPAHNLHTIRAIINRWAPPSENDTEAYITVVVAALGIGADVILAASDVNVLTGLCTAIVRHENGQQPYPETMLRTAALVALGRPVDPVVPPSIPGLTPAAPRTTLATAAAVAGTPPREPEELRDVPWRELVQTVKRFRDGGADVTTTPQPNGLYTVLATYRS